MKCKNCKYGGKHRINKDLIYFYQKAIKKIDENIIEIDYLKNEYGCRSSENNNKQKECLLNNFKFFEEY